MATPMLTPMMIFCMRYFTLLVGYNICSGYFILVPAMIFCMCYFTSLVGYNICSCYFVLGLDFMPCFHQCFQSLVEALVESERKILTTCAFIPARAISHRCSKETEHKLDSH